MGVVKYSPGIEYVSGSLSKPKKMDGHNHGDYLIGTHRVAATENPNCTRLYIRKGDSFTRTNNYSQKELAIQNRFTEVSRAVRTRSKDLNLVTQDQAAFKAQKDAAGGKKTMRAYLWQVCGAEYDAEHNG